MCFYVRTKTAQTAEKDIVCYKTSSRTFWNGFASDVKGYKYSWFKKNLKVNISIETDPYWSTSVINEGYHAFKDKPNKRGYDKPFLMVIPKGTIYYENDEQYVAEKIIYVGRAYLFLTKLKLALKLY